MRCFRHLRFLWRCYPLFNAFGVPVQLHSSSLFFPVSSGVWFGWMCNGTVGALMTLGMLAAMLFCILVHEFAHVISAASLGIATRRVVILPVGCAAVLEDAPSYGAEVLVAVAGPAANALLALLGWGAMAMIGPAEDSCTLELRIWLNEFFVFNLAICIFNLLPCFPMDGGRILRGTLAILIGLTWPTRASEAVLVATKVAVRWLAWPICLGMIALSIVLTHAWEQLVVFMFLPLLGEAEVAVLEERLQLDNSPALLKFLPVTALRRSRRQTALRFGRWRDIMTIEAVRAVRAQPANAQCFETPRG